MSNTTETTPSTRGDISADPTNADASKAVGRVVIELSASGALYIEQYTNGQRQRTLLDRGNEWWQVMDALALQRRHTQSAAERKAEREETARIARHNRVFNQANQDHGFIFAVTRIGGKIPSGYKSAPNAKEFGHYLNAPTQKQLAEKAKKQPDVVILTDNEAEFL